MPEATLSATGKKHDSAPMATLLAGPTPNSVMRIGSSTILGVGAR